MGIAFQACIRIRNTYQPQHFSRFFICFRTADTLVFEQSFGHLVADTHHGIERGHRILKDHGDFLPAYFPDVGLGKREQITAVEPDFSTRDPSRRRRDQAQDGKNAHGFARAAFADYGQ